MGWQMVNVSRLRSLREVTNDELGMSALRFSWLIDTAAFQSALGCDPRNRIGLRFLLAVRPYSGYAAGVVRPPRDLHL